MLTGLAQDRGESTRYEIADETRASFRVREQVVGISFQNDAVGMTTAVEGALVLGPDGTVDAHRRRS